MLKNYHRHVLERSEIGAAPQPLNAEQTNELIELLKNPPQDQHTLLIDLIINRIPPGVDEAAYIKAAFLTDLIKNKTHSPLITPEKAIQILGMMQGGYNISILVQLLDHPTLAPLATEELKHTLLIYEAFHDIAERADAGNLYAQSVLKSWADAEWFSSKPALPEILTITVFKVPGETNTDDLSPAPDAWSRPDIPLHALSMYKKPREGVTDPIASIQKLKEKKHPVALVGDVLGTGSSRKSASNSVLWWTGHDKPGIPNKRTGGICLAGKIAPIFFNTLEDSGALPIECDVSTLETGQVIDISPYTGEIFEHNTKKCITTFQLKSQVLLDEVRAGGRINLIIGRSLTQKAREKLNLPATKAFQLPEPIQQCSKGFTLAQKIVGLACNQPGIRPGEYCEPKMTTVGSQDTTGPMTRDELKDLACLGFSADLVLQTFCHTAAYPKPIDIDMQHTLPDFIMNRGGISLKPNDGIIHSWLNRMLLPDTVGTGADSHTRFPIGISFPAGSGLVAFAAATGIIPLDMPESVLVRFSGKMKPGITLRDLVHAIPYFALQKGLLTLEKKGKINVFSGRILEIQGLEDLTVEQAFELSDASAERSCTGCTIRLSRQSIQAYLNSNITLLKWMIQQGYGEIRSIERRIQKMEAWIEEPTLLEADDDAEYHTILDIDINQISEPILCVPNDPDNAKKLSEVSGQTIDEVFLGSCMTNIGHFRAAGKLLEQATDPLKTKFWIAPPTKMDKQQLIDEGYYAIYEKAGVRLEIPGCSLCMGNQARVNDGATVLSTSTRNFPNRLGDQANVYLCSAELAAVGAILGYIPTTEEYQQYAQTINTMSADIYRYLNFDTMKTFQEAASQVIIRST
ncbi:MAG: bifunctional aconitate hydratase 2/2-methylisocitrate dehydratase [Endozoicomonadaceae bacterium]|nr:bifunctional aconitate hydratase 2/2-methylisocitrate dehydratase [Endozoicomonadaceae bacterium]